MTNNQPPSLDLTKCADCRKPFAKGQEYHKLYREEKPVMCFCLDCFKLYSGKNEVWE